MESLKNSFVNLLEHISAVWNLINRNKIRSFLTMLGIIVGIMSVIVVMSVGAGAQSLILNQVTSMGSNLIGVLPGKSDSNGPPASALGIVVKTLTTDDIKHLVGNKDFPHIIAGTGYVRGVNTINWEENKVDTSFIGVSADLPFIEDTNVSKGRFFTDEEDRSQARVAVLGSAVAKDLFGDNDPLGEQIKIKKLNFNIIGVMRTRGSSGFQNQDNQIYVPITTAQKLLLGIEYVNFARLKVDNAENIDNSMIYVTEILRERHNIDDLEKDDFSVRSMAQGVDSILKITDALKIFLTAVAGISLVVGGIGIMNIMLAAVEERTREIGLRKAVGAKNKNIVTQFLVETVMVTFFGGLIGMFLGILISATVAKIATSMGYNWDLVISVWSILLSAGVSIGIGLLFGIIPARRAAGLNPIEALRYE